MGRNPKKNLVKKAALVQKSEELGIQMERLLAAYVMEQLAVMLSESKRGNRLLLKNPEVLGLSGMTKNDSHRLHYVYAKQPKEAFSKADFTVFLKQTIKWETQTNIEWSWRSNVEGTSLIVEITAVLDEMRMPVELIVEPLANVSKESYDTCSIRLIMESDRTCKINSFSVQRVFFEDLGEILTKLELISDMAAYERVYEALGVLSFEGRQFQKLMSSYCNEHGIVMDEVRFGQMERYLHYPYMKKKWNAYLKKRKKETPSWEEVFGKLWSFLMPPWKAALEEMVYLGSWISDLGRYLD